MTSEVVWRLAPEIILVLAATAIYLGGTFTRARDVWNWAAVGAILLSGLAMSCQADVPARMATADLHSEAALSTVDPPRGFVQFTPIFTDRLSLDARWFVLAAGLTFVMIASRAAMRLMTAEYVGSLLLIVAGLMLVASAADLVLMFVGLELVSIPTYAILYLGRRDMASQESAAKYFFLSVLSSALLLYGFSFLYGVAGSMRLGEIHSALAAPGGGGFFPFASLALVLILAGLGFRLTMAPFHFYAPDVFQGTSNPNAGLLSVAPKIAGLVALTRIVIYAMAGMEDAGWQLTLAISILTMTVGNVLALWQHNIRRLMAYSSIAHAGYILIGVAVSFAASRDVTSMNLIDGLGAALFYLVVYSVGSLGVFAALSYLSSETRRVDSVDDLAGLSKTHPFAALSIAIFMFSLAGLPPLAGFWGKLALLTGALKVDAGHTSNALAMTGSLRPWFVSLALVGVLNAAIAAAYYLRVVAVMFFRPSGVTLSAAGGLRAASAMLACAALVVVIGLSPGHWLDEAMSAGVSAKRPFDGYGYTPTSPIVLDHAAASRDAAMRDSAISRLP